MLALYLTLSFVISGLLFVNRNTFVNYFLVVGYLVLHLLFTYHEYTHINIEELHYFKADSLAILLLLTLAIISIPAFYHSFVYVEKNNDNPRIRGIYFSAIVILITSLAAAYLSNHIALTWVFVEMTTLSSAALIYHRRNERTLEATWKYVFICAISVTIVFIGIIFLSIAMQEAGSSELSYAALISKAKLLNPFWLKLAFLFIFTGFTAKMSLVPMFTAGVDAKDKAPSPAGALFSSVLANVGFVGFFRTYMVIGNSPLQGWANFVLMISAFLSVFVGAVYMYKVGNIKRMLAYSTLEHMGLVMLGIAAGGIGYYAALLHIVLHAFVKSSFFFQIGQVYRVYQSKSIYDIGNYFKYNLPGALVLLFGFFCATAMPPSGLFTSEFMIFRALFNSHHFIILVIVLFLLTTIIWAFGKTILKMCFTPPQDFDETRVPKISPVESISQFILLGFTVYLGYNPPEIFIHLLQESVKMLPH